MATTTPPSPSAGASPRRTAGPSSRTPRGKATIRCRAASCAATACWRTRRSCSNGAQGPTHVFVQAGVGGLAAAVIGYLWAVLPERPTFIVVEPKSADCWFQSNAAGRPALASGNADTVMGGLACREISPVTWPIVGEATDWFMTIEEDEVTPARRLFAHPLGGDPAVASGPSGCAGLAGLMRVCADKSAFEALKLDRHSRVLLDQQRRQPRRTTGMNRLECRDQPLSAAACQQSRALVGVGRGGAGRGQAHQPADPALGRLCRLPLVPCHGARELRIAGSRGGDERAVRQHQGRSRGAARRRRHLHAGAAYPGRAGRLAAHHVLHARRRAVLGRHLLPLSRALRPAELHRRAARRGPGLPRQAAGHRDQSRRPPEGAAAEDRQQGDRDQGRGSADPARRCSTRSPSGSPRNATRYGAASARRRNFPRPTCSRPSGGRGCASAPTPGCSMPSPSRSTACARAASTITWPAASRATPPTTNG